MRKFCSTFNLNDIKAVSLQHYSTFLILGNASRGLNIEKTMSFLDLKKIEGNYFAE